MKKIIRWFIKPDPELISIYPDDNGDIVMWNDIKRFIPKDLGGEMSIFAGFEDWCNTNVGPLLITNDSEKNLLISYGQRHINTLYLI